MSDNPERNGPLDYSLLSAEQGPQISEHTRISRLTSQQLNLLY